MTNWMKPHVSGSANATLHIVESSTSDSFTNEARVYSAVRAQKFKDFKDPNCVRQAPKLLPRNKTSNVRVT